MRENKHVVLCVDDDQDVLDALRPVLEQAGYEMVEASCAEDGLRKYKEAEPDVIIVDLMMEEIDAGTSLVTDLAAAGNTAPVYMLSSVGDRLSSSTDYNALGLSGVFQKPVDTGRLLSVLKTVLR